MPPGFPRRAVLLLAALAILLRVGTNLSRVDEHYPEGLVRGVVAQAWIEGLPLWPAQTPQIQHIRGSVVMSALAVPSFLLLGPTTFAVRLGGLPFHLLGLLFLVLLVHRLHGRRAAALAGGLWVLAVPSIAKISVLSYGDHIESLAFLFATVWLVQAWLDAPSPRRGLAFAAGLAAGLGVSWHAQSRLGVMAVALSVLLVAPRRALSRDTFTGLLPGLLAGLVPMALGDWITAQRGLSVMGGGVSSLLGKPLAESLAAWAGFWTGDLPHALQYPWLGWAVLLLSLAGACALGLLAAAARRGPRGLLALWRREAPLLVYVLVFTAVYATSRFSILRDTENAIMVRYVLPVVPVLLLPIAVAGGALADRGRRALSLAVAAPALALGAYGSLSTIDPDAILHEPPRRAAFWESAGPHLFYAALSEAEREELRALELSLYGEPDQESRTLAWAASHADAGRLAELIERHDPTPPALRPLTMRLGPPWLNVTARAGGTGSPAEMRALLEGVPPRWRPDAIAQAGMRLGSERVLRVDAIAVLLAACRSPDERRLLARGLGIGASQCDLPRFFRGDALKARLRLLPEALSREELGFGFGYSTGGMIHAFYPPAANMLRQFLEHAPPASHAGFARGLGAGYRRRFLDPPPRELDSPGVRHVVARLAEHDPALEAPFRDGLGGLADG